MTAILLVASLALFLGIGVVGSLYGARGFGEREPERSGWTRPGSLSWWLEDVPPGWVLGLSTAMGVWIVGWIVVLLVGLSLIFSA